MKSKKLRLVYSIMALIMVLSVGCGNKTESTNTTTATATGNKPTVVSTTSADEKVDPFGKYDKTVSLTTGKELKNDIKLLPGADTAENNEYTRYITDTLNIKVTNAWEAPEGAPYDQKISLAIASNDLPDMLVLTTYAMFKTAVRSGLVQDITSVYEKYTWPVLKDIYSAEDGKALNTAKIDGKLMALVTPSITADAFNLLWLRKDWLDKLNLVEPKSLDDIINIAKAFRDKDPDGNGKNDTVGFSATTAHESMDPIYALYNSYPKLWLKDSSGKVFYGSTAPETKTALAKLRELYTNNIIDKEFALRKDPMELIASNKAGMFIGAWYSPWYPLPDSVKNDPKAEWRPYLAPLNDQGKANVHMQQPAIRWLVVSQNCKNPDAVMKVVNLVERVERKKDPMYGKFYNSKPELNSDSKVFFPIYFNVDYADAVARKYAAYKDAFEGKTKITDLDAEGQINLAKYKTETENPKKDLAAYSAYTAYNFGAVPTISSLVNKIDGVFYGQTKTMESKWTNIDKFENESFLKIIMGSESIDYFDTFVKQWKQMGGDQITTEVEEAIK